MNMDINDFSNPMNFELNTFQNNRINLGNNDPYYQVNDFQQNNTNLNNNIYSYDKRVVLCLKYLKLNKFIPNFIKRGIKFEDFLSLSNNDLTSFKIPPNIQDVIQKFMIDYFNFGSMYTIDEIIKFFKTRKGKRYSLKNDDINLNVRNKENMNYIKYKSVNNKRMPNNYNNNNYNQNMNINNNYLQNNLNDNMNNIIRRPKSQSNKMLSNTNYFSQNKRNVQNNLNKKGNMNNNINNMKIPRNNNNIHRKNNQNNIYDNTDISNGNMSSLPSNQNNNINFYSSSIDNFSHMAMKENSPQLLNIMKTAKHKNINTANINQLKKNLEKNFVKAKKIKNGDDINVNHRNKKIIDNNKPENMGLSRSTSKDIIKRMDEILKRCGSRKKSSNSSITLNMNKGYHSDENLKAKRNLQEQIINNNLNNINLEGYEINTYYAGDTSKLSSLYNNNIYSETKQIKKGGNIHHHSKINKAKKINEEQKRKIEYLIAHGGNSSLKSDNFLIMNDYGFNDIDEISLITDNISKTNLTNYTNINNNFNNIDNINNEKQKIFSIKNNYMNQVNQVNNNINSSKQKNLLIQRKNYKNKISKNKLNNFNTHASNRKNISSNYYQNNNYNNHILEENIRLNNNIIHIQNQNKINRNDGPIQISLKNNKKYKNNNIIIPPNYNNIKERKNDFNNFNNFSLSQNNNSISNYSMGNKIQNKNIINYPLNNNYINNFINIKNNKQNKRNTKSYDKQIKNRVYPGIHNINNNINNININNINYDGKRLSDGFNNLIDFDMNMNYHRTQNNFYQPNNLLNNNVEFNDIY